MPYYNENTVYYRRLTASYGDVQLPPLGTTADVVSATPRRNHSRTAEIVAVGRIPFRALPHSTGHENFLRSGKRVRRSVSALKAFSPAYRTARFRTSVMSVISSSALRTKCRVRIASRGDCGGASCINDPPNRSSMGGRAISTLVL